MWPDSVDCNRVAVRTDWRPSAGRRSAGDDLDCPPCGRWRLIVERIAAATAGADAVGDEGDEVDGAVRTGSGVDDGVEPGVVEVVALARWATDCSMRVDLNDTLSCESRWWRPDSACSIRYRSFGARRAAAKQRRQPQPNHMLSIDQSHC